MYRLVGGINIAPPRQNYELVMSHERHAAKLRTLTDDFERLLDMRRQLARLGYRFVSLLPHPLSGNESPELPAGNTPDASEP